MKKYDNDINNNINNDHTNDENDSNHSNDFPRSHGPPQDREHRPPLRAEARGRQLQVPPIILTILMMILSIMILLTMILMIFVSLPPSARACKDDCVLLLQCWNNTETTRESELAMMIAYFHFDVDIRTPTEQTGELSRMIADSCSGAEIKARNRLCRPSCLSYVGRTKCCNSWTICID